MVKKATATTTVDPQTSKACPVCGHGLLPNEVMNEDGTCPITEVARVENELLKAMKKAEKPSPLMPEDGRTPMKPRAGWLQPRGAAMR